MARKTLEQLTVELEAVTMELTEKTNKLDTLAADAKSAELKFKFYMTIGLGCGIPLLSLALSKFAGTLATHNFYPLALFAFGLMITVLVVSLPHLAWSIGDITRSSKVPSWCLAIALDLSIVLCEFCHVWAEEAGLGWLIYTVMIAVCVTSMVLNCWAFFKAPTHN